MSTSAIGMPNATAFINRSFQLCDPFQWVREILVNSIESHATKIEFGVEWEGVRKERIYRRMVSDNGEGMSSDKLYEYFKNIGESGSKRITSGDMMDDAIHSNYGMGCRISLLPSNKAGLIYLSYQKGKGALIKMSYDFEIGAYVIDDWDFDEEKKQVIDPDEVDWSDGEIDWSKVAPAWVRDQGTCVIFMGNDEKSHTFSESINGLKPNRVLAKYINSRFVDLSKIDVKVVEFNFEDVRDWPESESDLCTTISGKTNTNTRKGTTRVCHGAMHYIREAKPQGEKKGNLKSEGVVLLEDGRLKIKWYLWEGYRTQIGSYANDMGFIAIHYGDESRGYTELYGANNSNMITLFRNFGIYEKEVRDRLTLILEPKVFMQDSQWGIFPDNNRAHLYFSGDGEKSVDLPIAKWGLLFVKNMPSEIREAQLKAQIDNESGEYLSTKIIKKLLSKLGDRFRNVVGIYDQKGKERGTPENEQVTTIVIEQGEIDPKKPGDYEKVGKENDNPPQPPQPPRPQIDDSKKHAAVDGKDKVKRRVHRKKVDLETSGQTPASRIIGNMEFPQWCPVGKGVMKEEYHICCYDENHMWPDNHIAPAVLLNVDAPVIVDQIRYHQESHHPEYHDEIKKIVTGIYGQVACCKVAHALKMIKKISKEKIKDNYLSEESLTTAMLGLISEDAFIAPKLGTFGPKVKDIETEEKPHEIKKVEV
jgi:hypothetical protein